MLECTGQTVKHVARNTQVKPLDIEIKEYTNRKGIFYETTHPVD